MHRAGERIVKGEPIYNPADRVTCGIDIYKYSPVFAFFMAPFTKMHMHKSVLLWYLLTFISLLFSVYIFKRIITDLNRETTLSKFFYFATFFLILRFILVMLSRVQSDFLVLFFLSLSAWFLYRKREILSGFSLASAIMVKLTPLIFIPYFIYRKFYKAAVASLGGVLLYLWLPSLQLGWQKNIAYLKDWFDALFYSTPELISWYKNQSLLSCIFRLFSEKSAVKIIALSPPVIKSIFILVCLVMVFFTLYFCARLILRTEKGFGCGHLIEFSLILICMVLFSPLAWKHTFLHLLPGYMVLLYYLIRHPRDFITVSLLLMSFILSSILNPEILKSYDEVVSLYSAMTWGAVILYIALLRVARRLTV